MSRVNKNLFSAVRAGSAFVATLGFCALIFTSPVFAADLFKIVEKGEPSTDEKHAAGQYLF